MKPHMPWPPLPVDNFVSLIRDHDSRLPKTASPRVPLPSPQRSPRHSSSRGAPGSTLKLVDELAEIARLNLSELELHELRRRLDSFAKAREVCAAPEPRRRGSLHPPGGAAPSAALLVPLGCAGAAPRSARPRRRSPATARALPSSRRLESEAAQGLPMPPVLSDLQPTSHSEMLAEIGAALQSKERPLADRLARAMWLARTCFECERASLFMLCRDRRLQLMAADEKPAQSSSISAIFEMSPTDEFLREARSRVLDGPGSGFLGASVIQTNEAIVLQRAEADPRRENSLSHPSCLEFPSSSWNPRAPCHRFNEAFRKSIVLRDGVSSLAAAPVRSLRSDRLAAPARGVVELVNAKGKWGFNEKQMTALKSLCNLISEQLDSVEALHSYYDGVHEKPNTSPGSQLRSSSLEPQALDRAQASHEVPTTMPALPEPRRYAGKGLPLPHM
ncbi:hypothetical protein AB1Y20_016730 [Prymnesium parvum]|uniref:GAF domain-containing protein n=1 Tax=Prymnesium parvum TaxID=97485 RepID=A0AB34I8Q5_PRYPA